MQRGLLCVESHNYIFKSGSLPGSLVPRLFTTVQLLIAFSMQKQRGKAVYGILCVTSGGLTDRVQRRRSGAKTTEAKAHMAT